MTTDGWGGARRVGRPRGSHGEVRQALLEAWAQGPAPVREVAQRAQVGLAVARYTASRMTDDGQLKVVVGQRPAVLALADDERVCALSDERETLRVRDALHALGSAFWECRDVP